MGSRLANFVLIWSLKIMSLFNLTNEIVGLVVSVTALVFPIGIAIYTFRYKETKDNLQKHKELKIESVEIPKFKRLKGKTNKLFIWGVVTIFYAIFVKIIIFQFILNSCFLWLMLIGSVIFLVYIFHLFYSIFYEIS